jgi:Zn-finger nucleic acid-binding protein
MAPRILTCPDCSNVQLIARERSTIEIDECPTCRGVWLDRGELDKLIALALAGRSVAAVLSPRGEDHEPVDDDE